MVKKATDKGFAKTQFKLVKMYASGEGNKQDPKSNPSYWIKHAAAQGHAKAQEESRIAATGMASIGIFGQIESES